VDLQSALEKLLPERSDTRQFGVHRQYDHSTLTFANLMGNVNDPAIIAPMQSRMEGTPFALLLSPAERYGQTSGAHLEIAAPPGEMGRGPVAPSAEGS
jgi:hypothetical protein